MCAVCVCTPANFLNMFISNKSNYQLEYITIGLSWRVFLSGCSAEFLKSNQIFVIVVDA